MAEVDYVTKRGEYYTVTGTHKGRPISVDIPAPTVESKNSRDAKELFRRSVERIGES